MTSSRVVKIVLLILLSTSSISFTQVFQHLTEDNGLPINNCNSMAQDSFGMIWITTENGLVRFDGVNTKIYQYQPDDPNSISANSLLSVHVGESGRMFVAGNDGYINEYLHNEDNIQRTYISEIDSVPDRRIYEMLEQDSILWMAAEVGLLKHNLHSGRTRVINPRIEISTSNHPYLQTIMTFFQDRFDPELLWIGTRAGLISVHKPTMSFEFHTTYINDIPNSSQYGVLEIKQTDDGIIWVSGSWSGIKSYDPSTKKWTYYFAEYYPRTAIRNDVHSFTQKSQNEFWISSYANGFGTFNIADGSYQYFKYEADNPYTVQKKPTEDVITDRHGNIWICGQYGVSWFHPDFQKIKIIDLPPRRVPHGLTDNLPSAFEMISDHELLVSTVSGDGLYIADLETGQTEVVEDYVGMDFNRVLNQQTPTNFYDLQMIDLLKVSPEKIWVSVDSQFAFFDIPSRQLVFPETTNRYFYKNNNIQQLQLDSEGNMWGINRWRRSLFKADANNGILLDSINYLDLLPEGIGEEKAYGITGFYIDQNDLFWFHTYSLVFTRDMKTGKTYVIPKKSENRPGTEGIAFYHISGSTDGNIYVASSQNGMQIIRPTAQSAQDSFQLLGIADGLPIEKTIRVTCYEEYTFLATRKGLVKYHDKSGEISIYDKQHGVPNHDLLNYWTPSLNASRYGHVFFGNPDKICWMDIDDEQKNWRQPNIRFTDLFIQGKDAKREQSLLASDQIRLGATENFFTIRYATDDFTLPSKQEFRYRLIGYDDGWVEAGHNREATYTKVPGGDYTLEVMGSNGLGIWSEPNQISISVETPFFKSQLFYGLLALTALFLFYLIYRYRMEQVQVREKLKSDFSVQLAEVEMTALRAQMNPHFVFNSLNSINKYILTNEPRTASRYLTKFSQLMRLILNNSKSKEVTLEDELSALSLYVEMEQLRFDQKFEFKKTISTALSPSSILIPPMLIQPYVENAIWHGLMPLEHPGRLTISIEQVHDHLICVIDDNGIGRSRAQEIKQNKGVRKKSMGMQITSDRIALVEALHQIKTEIRIEDKVDQKDEPLGTTVTLKLPFTKSEVSHQTK